MSWSIRLVLKISSEDSDVYREVGPRGATANHSLCGNERVAFHDESESTIALWKWDFGDGSTSTDRHPLHQYPAGRNYTAILEVKCPPANQATPADGEVR